MLYFIRTDDEVKLQATPPAIKSRWMAQITLRAPIAGNKLLMLVNMGSDHPVVKYPQHKYEYNIHILKSNLQKTFRRQLWMESLATLRQMIYQDPVETLRRLPVILLEDSMLHPQLYRHIIWLQFAISKGYRLTTHDIQIIIDSLSTGLESASRYNLSLDAGVEGGLLESGDMFWDQPESARTAYIGPCMRSLAGGMKFDTDFLRVIALRALAGELPVETTYCSVDVADIEEFDAETHIIPQAIDFHCCPQILTEIPYKDAIWWNWSSYNTRAIIDRDALIEEARIDAKRAEHETTFNSIEHLLLKFARRQIKFLGAQRKEPIKRATLDGWLAKV